MALIEFKRDWASWTAQLRELAALIDRFSRRGWHSPNGHSASRADPLLAADRALCTRCTSRRCASSRKARKQVMVGETDLRIRPRPIISSCRSTCRSSVR